MKCPKCEGELDITKDYLGPISHECGFSGKISISIADDIMDGYVRPNIFARLWYRVSRLYEEFVYTLKCFGQRIKYGFPLYQSWEFRSWHSEIVVPRLKHLRNDLNGYPTGMTMSEWESILDKMIWSFENTENEPGLDYPEEYDYRYIVYRENNCKTYIPVEQDLKPSLKRVEEHMKKVQEGLDMFAKYYLNLWD